MSVYAVAQIAINDRDEYKKYEEGFMEAFLPHEGELLAVDDNAQVIEGEWPFTRMVVLRFPDKQSFRDWYESDAYQQLLQHRLAASSGTVLLFDALPQL